MPGALSGGRIITLCYDPALLGDMRRNKRVLRTGGKKGANGFDCHRNEEQSKNGGESCVRGTEAA